MAPIGMWFRKRSAAASRATEAARSSPSQADINSTRESYLDISKYAEKYAVVTDAYVADAAVEASRATQQQKRRENSLQEMRPLATAHFVNPEEPSLAGAALVSSTTGSRAQSTAIESLPAAVREQENLWRQLRRGPTTSMIGKYNATSAVVQEQEQLWQQLRQQQSARPISTTSIIPARQRSAAGALSVREEQSRLWDEITRQQTSNTNDSKKPTGRDQECLLMPQAEQLIAEQANLLRGFQDAKEDSLLKMACQASRATAMAEQHGEELYLLRTLEVSLREAENPPDP